MTKKGFAAVGAIFLLAACREQAAENQAGEARDNAAAAATPAEATLGAAVSGDAAKKLMHDRHEGMEDIGDAMKVVSRELKDDGPDLGKVREGAATMARLATEAAGWFPPGTGPDVGKTRAKAEIWQKPEDFAAKANTFQTTAQAFNAAAQGTDLAAIRAAHGELGKSCKACHDLYRTEKKEHD